MRFPRSEIQASWGRSLSAASAISSSMLLVLHCVVSLSSPSSSEALRLALPLALREATRELARLEEGVVSLERALRETVLPLSRRAFLRRSRIFSFAFFAR